MLLFCRLQVVDKVVGYFFVQVDAVATRYVVLVAGVDEVVGAGAVFYAAL